MNHATLLHAVETAPLRTVILARRELMAEGIARSLAAMHHLVLLARCDPLHAAPPPAADLVVLDTTGVGTRLVETIERLKKSGTRVLVVLEEGREASAAQLVRLGVDGILTADVAPRELHDAVCRIAAGDVVLSRRLQTALLREARGPDSTVWLSDRERDVMRLAAQGRGNKEIASAMRITEGTVKSYLRRLMGRLDARDRTHAVVIALRRGLFELDDA